MRRALVLALLTLGSSASGQTTTWTNLGDGITWASAANWSAGIPTASTTAVIGTQPTSNLIGIDTGVNVTVAGLNFGSSLTASMSILASGAEQLISNGLVSNLSSVQQSFALPVVAGTGFSISGSSPGLQFSSLIVGVQNVTTSGSVSIGSSIVFDLNSTLSYGRIGSVSVTGATINIVGSYTGTVGEVFDLTTGSFSGATIGDLPTLDPGLAWETSQFLTNGTLTVVPEPASVALVTAGLLAGLIARRRRWTRR